MKNQKKWYLGRRDNPQFKDPYFKAYGQLTKKDAMKKENCLYGSITVIPHDTLEEYEKDIRMIIAQGLKVV